MNTTDPNLLVEHVKGDIEVQHVVKATESKSAQPNDNGNAAQQSAPSQQQSRGGRVPPGGFSSGGFW